MFTGIVAAIGAIRQVEPLAEGGGVRLEVGAGSLGMDDVAIGDSIAIQGACMTVVTKSADGFTVDNTGLTLRVDEGAGKSRLIVSRVSGAAERAGLKRGDEILAVSQISVNDESSFRSALAGAGKNVPLLVQRDGNTLFLALTLQ